jgi:hypothetical protein
MVIKQEVKWLQVNSLACELIITETTVKLFLSVDSLERLQFMTSILKA